MSHEKNDKIFYKDESYQIQGAIFEVYKEMGCGFLEPVSQECLAKELYSRSIHFIAQQPLMLSYKGEELKQKFKPDLVCFGKIIVELKAVKKVTPQHKAQVINYLWDIPKSLYNTPGVVKTL